MERLTRKIFNNDDYYVNVFKITETNWCDEDGSNKESAYTGEAINKLATYEDAEEHGKLLILPCKIEDRVYRIINKWENNYGCCACTGDFGGGDCAYWINEECTNIDGMYGDNKIITIRFRYEHIPQYGKTVFLTRKNAEDALNKKVGV